MMATKISSRKAKGRKLQQWAAQKVSLLIGLPCGPDEQIASREMGQGGCDVRLIGEARTLFPWSVECKNQEKLNIWSSLEQAENNSGNHAPLVVFKRNRTKTYAVLEFDKLLELLNESK